MEALRPGLAHIGPALILSVLVVYLAFRAGGFYRDGAATAVLGLSVFFLLRVALAEDPFRGYGRWLACAVIPLALLTGWVLASAIWSNSPGRAVDESSRALLYLLTLAVFASFSWSQARVRWLIRAYGLALGAVCLAAFVSRALPDLVDVSLGFVPTRLSYPVTYWNTLGLMAALGIVLCLSMAGDDKEAALPRILAAAAMPVLGVTLLLTFSRGAIGVAVLGVVAYVVFAHVRGLLTGVVAVAPPTALAVVRAYDADLLATANPTTPAAIAQGHSLAKIVLLCSLGAAALRIALLAIDRRLIRLRVAPERRRAALAGGFAALVVAALVTGVAVNLPTQLHEQYAEFVRGGSTEATDVKTRERLASLSNNGRLEHWQVAGASFRASPAFGQGAGSFETEWAQRRPITFDVIDAHSLYLETAAELGLVGLLLLVASFGCIVIGLARRARGPDRAPWTALLVCALIWMVHAGVDWDWEMPAVSIGFFAGGGLVLSSRRQRRRLQVPGPMARILLCLGLVVFSLLPLGIWLSHRSLEQADREFNRGRCPEAISSALEASGFLNAYAEPYEILGYCDARLGEQDLAVRMMRTASERDPENWRYHYGLAIVRGVARLDPRRQAERAVRLNPRSDLARALVRELSSIESPAGWEDLARKARVPGR